MRFRLFAMAPCRCCFHVAPLAADTLAYCYAMLIRRLFFATPLDVSPLCDAFRLFTPRFRHDAIRDMFYFAADAAADVAAAVFAAVDIFAHYAIFAAYA